MRQKATDGYDDRLAWALKEGPRPMSVRGLADEMGREYGDLRGTSYGGIRQYAEGRVKNPRIELLRAIAELLDVRPDWLIYDEGPRTDKEAARREGGTALEDRAREDQRQRAAGAHHIQAVEAIDQAVRSYLDADVPLPARWCLTDLVYQVYDMKGPAAFGETSFELETEWSGIAGVESSDFPVGDEQLLRWIEQRIGHDLPTYLPATASAHRQHAMRSAAWLSATAALYLQELATL